MTMRKRGLMMYYDNSDSGSEASGSEESSDESSERNNVEKSKSESQSESNSLSASSSAAESGSEEESSNDKIEDVKSEPVSESSSSDHEIEHKEEPLKAELSPESTKDPKTTKIQNKKVEEKVIKEQKDESMEDESDQASENSTMDMDEHSKEDSGSEEVTESESESEKQENIGKVTFEYQAPESRALNFPHILNFPKAPLPPSCLAVTQDPKENETRTPLKLRVLRSNNSRRADQRVILANTDRMEYVGLNFGPEANSINRYVVGIFDKTKRKIRLVESTNVFSMEQRIKSFDESEREVKEEDRVRGNSQLVQEFGSKRSRSLLQTSIRNRVSAEDNIDQSTLESMSNSLKEKASTTMPLDAIQKGVRSDLPPYNPLAQTRPEIYNFATIIPKEIFNELAKEAKGMLSKSDADLQEEVIMSNEYPQSVLDHFLGLASSDNRREYACGIMYLIYLIRFHIKWNHRLSRLNDMSKAMNIPTSILPHLLSKFTAAQVISETKKRYVMNSNHKLKLVNYIFVSHLILSNYTMKLSNLMRDLQLDIKGTRMHAIKIGCTVVGGSKSFRGRSGYDTQETDAFSIPEITASLTCPLTFADPSASRKKKR